MYVSTDIPLHYGKDSLRSLKINAGRVHYLSEGLGTIVVLLHGLAGDHRYWQPVVEEVAKHHRVIAMSARHHFPSRPGEDLSDYTLENHVRDVIALVEALADEPVHLVGHSQGGNVAALMALARPDLVRSLVLEEGAFVEDAGSEALSAQAEAEKILSAVPELFSTGDLEGVARVLLELTGGTEWARTASRSYLQFLADNVHTLAARLPPAPLRRSDIASLTVPTLMIRGESSPRFVQLFLDATEASSSTMRKVVVSGAGHWVHNGDPARFNRALLDFVRQH